MTFYADAATVSMAASRNSGSVDPVAERQAIRMGIMRSRAKLQTSQNRWSE